MEMEKGYTERGFEIIRFKDYYMKDSVLQQSSLALFEKPGSPGSRAIWFGHADLPMHLTYEMVEELQELLVNWMNTGSFYKEA